MSGMTDRTVTPSPPVVDAPTRTRYDWKAIVPGEWQTWLDLNPDTDQGEARRRTERVRLAARDYASRHRMHLETWRKNGGRTLCLRFTSRDDK